MTRTIQNPVTGQRATYIETSRETGGKRSIIDVEVAPGGGVPAHRHTDHEERIEVVEGELEVTLDGKKRLLRAGEHVVVARGTIHSFRNPTPDRKATFRGMMTPGHPGFENFLRVLFGLARDGECNRDGIPKRLGDTGLLLEWDPSIIVGKLRLVAPLMRWSARRARARGRAEQLARRYGVE